MSALKNVDKGEKACGNRAASDPAAYDALSMPLAASDGPLIHVMAIFPFLCPSIAMESAYRVFYCAKAAAISACGRGVRLATAALVATFISVPVSTGQSKPTADPFFDRGMVLVSHNCGRCHAVENVGESTHPAAPPFRDLLQRYPIDALEESFIDEIYSQHPDMPVFNVTPEQLDAILYYIEVIQRD